MDIIYLKRLFSSTFQIFKLFVMFLFIKLDNAFFFLLINFCLSSVVEFDFSSYIFRCWEIWEKKLFLQINLIFFSFFFKKKDFFNCFFGKVMNFIFYFQVITSLEFFQVSFIKIYDFEGKLLDLNFWHYYFLITYVGGYTCWRKNGLFFK